MAFVYGVVAVAPSPGDTGLTLEPDDAAAFPDPADGTFDVLCVAPRTRIDAGHTEVLHVTELSGGEWTIERGWFDTTVREIAAGDALIYSDDIDAGDLLEREGLDSLPRVYTFTADGTWTAPPDTTYFSVALLGAGGGGAGGQVGTTVQGGGGGGGGAWVYMPPTSMEPFAHSYDFGIEIGAGGAGGAAGADGVAGGESTFSAYFGAVIVAARGEGGVSAGAFNGGDGGQSASLTWTLSEDGGSGGSGTSSTVEDGDFQSEFHRSGSGGGAGGWRDGAGIEGGGAGGSGNTSFADDSADGENGSSISGAGGGGGGNGGVTTGADGGNGGQGGGGGGGGGAGGTTAGAGGAGGDGLCFIFAH